MKKLLLIFVSLLLVACHNDNHNSSADVSIGKFLDSAAVIGIGYRTETQSGTTTPKGEFTYRPGEMITFFIGSLEFGPAPATAIITPLTIAKTTDINADINTEEVVNIALLLESLDADNDHENGLQIAVTAEDYINDFIAGFATPTMAFTAPTMAFIDQVADLIDDIGGDLIAVTPAVATANLQQVLTVLANLRSDDGDKINTASLTWRESTPTMDLAKLPIRKSHTSVVFEDRIWVLGGSDGDDDATNNIYSSTDGRDWTPAATPSWPARVGHTSVVFDDKIWVLGGSDPDRSNAKDDIWSSSDGVSWTILPSSERWTARAFHKSFVHDDKLWVVGGYGEGAVKEDIWSLASSIDGSYVDWVQEEVSTTTLTSTSTFLSGREGFAVFGLRDEVWLNGGVRPEAE